MLCFEDSESALLKAAATVIFTRSQSPTLVEFAEVDECKKFLVEADSRDVVIVKRCASK